MYKSERLVVSAMASVDSQDQNIGMSGTDFDSVACRGSKSFVIDLFAVFAERQTFPAFPYEPYAIQKRFMECLYATLSKGGVGLFESPTGGSPTMVQTALETLIITHCNRRYRQDPEFDL